MAYPVKNADYPGSSATKKFKALTQDYGAANKSQSKGAPGTLDNGPQKDYGYGTEGEGEASSARSDRPRRTSAANPIATYKRGGRVHEREKAAARAEGGAAPMPVVKSETKTPPMEADTSANTPAILKGKQARALGGGVIARARGGSVKKAPTTINIVVSPPQQAGANPALPPGGVGSAPPPMPKPPMGGPGPGAGGPQMPLPPGAAPPGLPPAAMAAMGRKRGGRVHDDAKEDAAQIRSMVKPSALRAKGGAVGLTAGAATGEGRLEKASSYARKSHKTQEV